MSAYLAVGVWHHWLVRRDPAFVARCWPTVRRALDWVVVAAAAVRRHRLVAGVARRTARHGQPRGPAGRLVEHLPRRCAPGLRSPSCSTTRSPSGSWPAAGSATRCASTATCSWTSRPSRWTGTTRCSAAPSAATRGRALLDGALGRLRGARPRGPLRRHQPLGHRRRDLRAGAGARRARRPRAGAARCSRTCSTCASDDGGYWTGYVYPDDVNWPAEHTTYTAAAVMLAARRAGRARPPGAGIMRGTGLVPDSGAARRSSAAAPSADARRRPRLTYARSTRSDPTASTSSKRRTPARAGRRRTAGGRRRPGRGTRRGSPAAPPGITQRRPAVRSRSCAGSSPCPPSMNSSDSGRAPVRGDRRGRADDGDHDVLEAGLARSCGGRTAACPSARSRRRRASGRGAPSRPGSPPSRGGGRR